MRFTGEAEFVGSFLVDLVAGSAWEHWYYGAFHRYRRADADATIRAVLGGERQRGRARVRVARDSGGNSTPCWRRSGRAKRGGSSAVVANAPRSPASPTAAPCWPTRRCGCSGYGLALRRCVNTSEACSPASCGPADRGGLDGSAIDQRLGARAYPLRRGALQRIPTAVPPRTAARSRAAGRPARLARCGLAHRRARGPDAAPTAAHGRAPAASTAAHTRQTSHPRRTRAPTCATGASALPPATSEASSIVRLIAAAFGGTAAGEACWIERSSPPSSRLRALRLDSRRRPAVPVRRRRPTGRSADSTGPMRREPASARPARDAHRASDAARGALRRRRDRAARRYGPSPPMAKRRAHARRRPVPAAARTDSTSDSRRWLIDSGVPLAPLLGAIGRKCSSARRRRSMPRHRSGQARKRPTTADLERRGRCARCRQRLLDVLDRQHVLDEADGSRGIDTDARRCQARRCPARRRPTPPCRDRGPARAGMGALAAAALRVRQRRRSCSTSACAAAARPRIGDPRSTSSSTRRRSTSCCTWPAILRRSTRVPWLGDRTVTFTVRRRSRRLNRAMTWRGNAATSAATPSNEEHLRDELAPRRRPAARAAAALSTGAARGAARALLASDRRVARSAGRATTTHSPLDAVRTRRPMRSSLLDRQPSGARDIDERIAATKQLRPAAAAAGARIRSRRTPSVDALLLALLPALHSTYRRWLGVLQHDPARSQATVGLHHRDARDVGRRPRACSPCSRRVGRPAARAIGSSR